jgi:restriction system protein
MTSEYTINEDSNRFFVGREFELRRLLNRFEESRGLIVIAGAGGIGKTALLNHFLASARVRRPPLLMRPSDETGVEIRRRINELYREKRITPEIVAIDEADLLPDQQLNDITSRVLNLKPVRTMIFTMRRAPDFTSAEVLQLKPLSAAEAQAMLRILSLSHDDMSIAVDKALGSPLALELLARLLQKHNDEERQRLLRGEIYDLNRQIILPEKKLITDLKPRIILANEALVERIKRHPASIYDLPPRKFEELVAELLADLGYEVQLTPATRDGGKDILAYMTTPHGKLLCLVEAKKYRRDRPVGVELVRQLYGTLTDADASSAMLVTTSSFSSDAKAFEQRHRYKLALRDYGNVVQWIEGYKKEVL